MDTIKRITADVATGFSNAFLSKHRPLPQDQVRAKEPTTSPEQALTTIIQRWRGDSKNSVVSMAGDRLQTRLDGLRQEYAQAVKQQANLTLEKFLEAKKAYVGIVDKKQVDMLQFGLVNWNDHLGTRPLEEQECVGFVQRDVNTLIGDPLFDKWAETANPYPSSVSFWKKDRQHMEGHLGVRQTMPIAEYRADVAQSNEIAAGVQVVMTREKGAIRDVKYTIGGGDAILNIGAIIPASTVASYIKAHPY